MLRSRVRWVLLAASGVLLAGCGSALRQGLPPVDASCDSAPVETFEQIVHGIEALERPHLRRNPQTREWFQRRVEHSKLRFDVRSTNSLVAPLVGVIWFDAVIRFGPNCPTKEEAIAGGDNDTRFSGACTLRFACQKGKWTFVEGIAGRGNLGRLCGRTGVRFANVEWVPQP